MAIIEKKYLLNKSIEELIKDEKKYVNISQFYTKIRLCKEIRYRKVDDEYIKTIRTGSDVRKNIVNKKISKKIYKKAKKKKIGKILKKRRYTLKVENDKFSIDKYEKHLKNLYIMEKSFKNLQKSQSYELPKALKKYIEEDVSNDNRYRNKNLALLGNPQKKQYELYKIYKEIELSEDFRLDKVLFKEMRVEDGARVILYKQFHKLSILKDKFLKTQSIDTLVELRRLIKESKILLKEFRFVFKVEHYKRVYNHLCMINKSISLDEEIDILKHNMPLLESVMDDEKLIKFIKYMDEKVEKKKNKIYKFLKSREFNILFNQYKLLLKEPSSINNYYYSDTNLYLYLKSRINTTFDKFRKLSKKYYKCYDLNGYKKIDNSLFKLDLLIKVFSNIEGIDRQKDIKLQEKLIKESRKNLNNFISLSKDFQVIKEYIIESSKTIQEQNKKIKRIKSIKKELESKYNQSIEESIKYLKKHKELF